jgi:hypothetical protein
VVEIIINKQITLDLDRVEIIIQDQNLEEVEQIQEVALTKLLEQAKVLADLEMEQDQVKVQDKD